jgi:hypothetical protein
MRLKTIVHVDEVGLLVLTLKYYVMAALLSAQRYNLPNVCNINGIHEVTISSITKRNLHPLENHQRHTLRNLFYSYA